MYYLFIGWGVATRTHKHMHTRTRKLTLKLINCIYRYMTAGFRSKVPCVIGFQQEELWDRHAVVFSF